MSLAHRPPLPRLVRRVRGTLGSGYDGYRPLLHLVDRPVGPQPLDEREDLAGHRTVPLGPQARRVTVGVLHRSGRVAGRLQRLHETKRRRGGAGVALRQATPPGYRRRPVRRGFGPDRQALQGAPRGAASRSRSNSGHRSNSARPERITHPGRPTIEARRRVLLALRESRWKDQRSTSTSWGSSRSWPGERRANDLETPAPHRRLHQRGRGRFLAAHPGIATSR
jgi:hypothetical protein